MKKYNSNQDLGKDIWDVLVKKGDTFVTKIPRSENRGLAYVKSLIGRDAGQSIPATTGVDTATVTTQPMLHMNNITSPENLVKENLIKNGKALSTKIPRSENRGSEASINLKGKDSGQSIPSTTGVDTATVTTQPMLHISNITSPENLVNHPSLQSKYIPGELIGLPPHLSVRRTIGNEALAHGFNLSGLKSIVNSPDIQQIVHQIKSRPDLGLQTLPDTDFRVLNQVQKALAKEIDTAVSQGDRKIALFKQEQREKLLNIMDNISPSFNQARTFSNAVSNAQKHMSQNKDYSSMILNPHITSVDYKTFLKQVPLPEKQAYTLMEREALLNQLKQFTSQQPPAGLASATEQEKLAALIGSENKNYFNQFVPDELQRQSVLNRLIKVPSSAPAQKAFHPLRYQNPAKQAAELLTESNIPFDLLETPYGIDKQLQEKIRHLFFVPAFTYEGGVE